MLFISIVLLVSVLGCDVSKNDEITGLNEDCNYAGTCVASRSLFRINYKCACCAPKELDPDNPCGEHWVCDPNDPWPKCSKFDGDHCDEWKKYFWASFGFRAVDINKNEDSDVICLTDPQARFLDKTKFNYSSIDFTDQVEYVLRESNYSGIVLRGPCDTCTPAYPCTVGTDAKLNVTEGSTYSFQSDFNTYYNKDCDVGQILRSSAQLEECPENYDFGQLANLKLTTAIDSQEKPFLKTLNTLLESQPFNNELGLGWSNTYMQAMTNQVFQSDERSVIIIPTLNPSQIPTEYPTTDPTPTPTYLCEPYTNDVDDLKQLEGVADDCRGGLDSSYPGGFDCASPYLICLPEENTPAKFGEQDYKGSDHKYTLAECKQECANDQRCSGIEYRSTGNCTLIDDIPIVRREGVGNTGALCFQKEKYCNPYFEAEDLSEQMLDCYCPNNRKGLYTKKVKRTVENSRFCGNDTEVDARIRKAQANRMFHLCENWCLFLTEDPAAESWYYDPWNKCWREQYADDSEGHRSFCNRVIIAPDTIEMQFVTRRVELACNATN